MSDRLSPEELEYLKSRDKRVRDLDLALQLDVELRESVVVKHMLEAFRADANRAFEEIADASPEEFKALQARVYRLVFVKRTIDAILNQGSVAADSLQAEDQVNSAAGEYD